MDYAEAHAAWSEEIKPLIIAQYGERDIPAMSESWNDYTDALCKDGDLTDLQYHYCPAWDDTIPGDDDAQRAYILDALGVTISEEQIATRDDAFGDMWDSAATHWRVTLARSSHDPLTINYSMGTALTGRPDLLNVVHCLITDWQLFEMANDFEEYCSETGDEENSRKAEKRYLAGKEQSEAFAALFSDVSLNDLAELFADY